MSERMKYVVVDIGDGYDSCSKLMFGDDVIFSDRMECEDALLFRDLRVLVERLNYERKRAQDAGVADE